MSNETTEWLKQFMMVGHTADKARWAINGFMVERDGVLVPWFGMAKHSYEGPIPVEDVRKYLFDWEPVEAQVHLRKPVDNEADSDGQDGDGNYFRWVVDFERKAIVHPITNHVFQYCGVDSYKLHGYDEWMIKNVTNMVDGEVGIDSAGLLRHGGQAFVTLSLSNDIEVAGGKIGFNFRPTIVASTSIDGSKASTYSVVNMIPVCDNSLKMAEASAAAKYRVKHTRHSRFNLNTARDALGIIYKQGEEFTKFIEGLMNVDVNDDAFKAIVNGVAPMPDPEFSKGQITNKRAITMAESKQAELWNLYTSDRRAAPWRGTLLGATQAVNTWNEHFRTRNDNQVERVMTGIISGSYDKMDAEFWDIIGGVKGIDLRGMKVGA